MVRSQRLHQFLWYLCYETYGKNLQPLKKDEGNENQGAVTSEPSESNALEKVCNTEGPVLSGPAVIKLFSCSTQLSTKFQLLINTKIATNKEVSCFKSLICCIYHANKC